MKETICEASQLTPHLHIRNQLKRIVMWCCVTEAGCTYVHVKACFRLTYLAAWSTSSPPAIKGAGDMYGSFFPMVISVTVPHKLLLQAGSNTAMITWRHHHHFPTLSLEQLSLSLKLPTYLPSSTLLTYLNLYPD
jgi:hypothetical protein